MGRTYSAIKELKALDDHYTKSDLNHVYQKHRAQIILLLFTIESIWKSKELNHGMTLILFEGLSHPWTPIFYYIVGAEINLMIGKINGIETIIYDGIKDSQWQTRINTVVIMKGFKHKKFKKKLSPKV